MHREPILSCSTTPPTRWRHARSPEAKCLWSSWRGAGDFPTRTDQWVLIVNGTQPRPLHCVNHGDDVPLGNYVRQLRTNGRLPPLRPVGPVAGRRRIRASALVVDPHPRIVAPSYASCQRANHSSQRTPPTATLAGNSTAHWGSSCGRQVSQAPAGLGTTGQLLGGVKPIIDLATTQSHPKAPLAAGQCPCRSPTVSPVTWAFSGGGDGIRTHGLYIAKVWFSVF